MANDLNRCTFIGRLGNDPECKFLPDGSAVTSISIAVGWKSKDKEGVEWIPVSFFGRLAEIAGEYLRKGSKIYVEGRFKTRKWQAQDGSDRYSTSIIADNMQMLDGKQEGQQTPTSNTQTPRANPQSSPQQAPDFGSFDSEDIPFMRLHYLA
jgi:single-strand DNA-binding protein